MRFDEVSDGHRALIVLYGLIHLAGEEESSVLLDEPDNYVGLSEIQPWLIKLADACGASVRQAVICSHHPELIDYLGGEAGLVLRGEASGIVTARGFDRDQLEGDIKLSERVARGWVG